MRKTNEVIDHVNALQDKILRLIARHEKATGSYIAGVNYSSVYKPNDEGGSDRYIDIEIFHS